MGRLKLLIGVFDKGKNMNIDLVYLIIIICCIILSAYFSATETAFSSLNRIRIKILSNDNSYLARLYAVLCTVHSLIVIS